MHACGGCPGGNIGYAPEEMKKNGVDVIHFATGMVVGYPPCPYIGYFKKYIEEKFGIKVVIGTHPIPEKYYTVHKKTRDMGFSRMARIYQADFNKQGNKARIRLICY